MSPNEDCLAQDIREKGGRMSMHRARDGKRKTENLQNNTLRWGLCSLEFTKICLLLLPVNYQD